MQRAHAGGTRALKSTDSKEKSARDREWGQLMWAGFSFPG